MTTVKISIGLRVIICFVTLWPAVYFSEAVAGYDAYTAWEDWARLRLGVQAGLASSYDRSGGNNDYSHYESPLGLLTTDVNATVKTIEGPGVIYRFWMPHVMARRHFVVRMYFNGETTPRINSDSTAIMGGTFSYFADPLITTCAGGQVCYEPIPFAQSLRIETVNKEFPPWANRHYYQYSYLTFPPGTAINSYTEQLTLEEQQARSAVVSLFENVGKHPAGGSQAAIDVNTPATVIGSDLSITLADLTGPGLIRKLNIGMPDANDMELDGLRLRVYYDGNSTPSIDVSAGSFFGTGKGRALYKSIPLGTDSNDGFYCYWPMPFRESMLVQLHNTTDANISIDSAVVQYEVGANVEKMCYLHVIESTSVRQSGQIYHPILSTTGCGHYIGDLLYVEQDANSFYMLEGDDVITVDGTITLNGTGLEDAYNGGAYYNWVAVQPDEPEGEYPRSATRPLNGILYVSREEELARADQYRWRIADCVPFSKSIEVNVENRYAITGSKWTSVAFWYQYPCVDGDFDYDCDVDFSDFAVFASHWLQSGCEDPNWCGGADFDSSRKVGIEDLAVLVEHWL